MIIAVASITYEGIIRNKIELLQKLKVLGHDIHIIAPYNGDNEDAKTRGFKFHSIKIESHGKNPLTDYKVYKNYKRIFKGIQPDMVLNLTIKPNVYSGMACKKLNIPYIGTINGVGDAIYNGGLLKKVTLFLLKKGLKKAKYVFFQNKSNKSLFITENIIPEEKAVLVPGSGINIDAHPYEEYPLEDQKIIFTFIGRVSRDKGIYELIEASKILKSNNEQYEINIVGSCPDAYKDLIEFASKDGLINYIGRVEPSAIHEILKESHAVLLPSYHEGIANVLLEGGAAGRPIIASLTEGCEETFEDGLSGIGFYPHDTDSLVLAMRRFLRMSYEERREMGLKAHEKIVSEFDRNIVDEAYIKTIHMIKR